MLDRRSFVSTAVLASASTLVRCAWSAQSVSSTPRLTIDPGDALFTIPLDFTGLSYESSQLTHPAFFSARNTALISFFRTLGEQGVLRIGGNMSEFTTWSNDDPAQADTSDEAEGPDPGKGTARRFTITPRSIMNLNQFLEATGWKLIYGLNLAAGSPESAADEAACVARICGPRLLALQFGNEPDLFKHDNDPKNRWTYAEFIEHWNKFYVAVHARVPDAPLAGPDTSFRPEWVGTFAADTKGKTCLLTAHYYAEGPPTNPDMTLARLLNDKTKFASNIQKAVDLANKANMPYRMSEGNSCYSAGKKGVSDTFGAALWAGDFAANVASTGAKGINLHGGGNGLYTEIAGSSKSGFTARPDYYGMLFARPLQGAGFLASKLDAQGENLTAYAVKKQGRTTVLAFNKSATDTTLEIVLPASQRDKRGTVLRLTAPSVEATQDVSLGGSAVAADGTWTPKTKEFLTHTNGRFLLTLPAYSAASFSV